MQDVAQWARWMTAANNTPDTITQRVYHVTRVLKELGCSDPWSVTAEQLVDFLGAKGWKPNTIRAYRASLRSFYNWGQGVGRRQDNPGLLIPRVRIPRGVPRPTPEDIYRYAARQADERVRLMIGLAAVCGLRRGEISRLRREDVIDDGPGYALHVKGKGGHERLVPLPAFLALKLRGLPAGYIFPSPSRPGPLTPAHVGKLVSKALPGDWTCHTLRHRSATVGYDATKDLRAVQEFLGHAKPETTALYTQIPKQSIRDVMNAAAA